MDDRYDLFLSCAGPDRDAVLTMRRALERAGLRVFLDEPSIGLFDPISREIETALRSSKALLAYYSRSYPSRPACQLELTAAFLAGQREGDPMRRIVVVNPEHPESDHLQPAELADHRYALRPEDGRALAALARRIADRVSSLAGTLAEVHFTQRPRWYGRPAGSARFVGRYREQWQLHSALHGVDVPLTREPTSGPVASLVGMPGIGKTSTATAYAWNFGAAYAAGAICWLSLAGVGRSRDAVLARYEDEVRTVAETMGLAAAGTARAQLLGLVADHLYGLPGPSLWVVDDVPDGLDPEIVRRLVLSAGMKARTLLLTHTDGYESVARPIVLGPMTRQDAGQLLRSFRAPEKDDELAFERLVPRLGGHPLVVELAGSRLRDREGLVSFADFADRLVRDPDASAVVADLLRAEISDLGPPARLILQLALVCAPATLPARLVGAVVGRVRPPDADRDEAGTGLAELRSKALAARVGTSWQVHSLVLDAARRHLDPPMPATDLARAAATALDELAADPDLAPTDRGDVIRHAAALAGDRDVPPRTADALLRRVVVHYADRGEPMLGAPYRDRLADLHPEAADLLAAAAASWHAAGEHETAVERATRALDLAQRAGDRAAAYQARRTLAEALDALSRYDQAEEHWRTLLTAPPAVAPADELATRVARIRGLRLRGRLAEVKQQATRLIADAGDPPADILDLVQAATLELARAEVLTDGQRQARTRAAAVLEHYRGRGLPEHARALEAQEVLAEAWLTLHLWELRPDPNDWSRAEDELRTLRERYRRSHGETNQLTLAAAVDLAYALVSQGNRDQGREELKTLLPALERRLGDRHPLFLRALFLQGLVHAQLQQHQQAEPLFERALHGQRAVLGAGHAHTLRTQYELAVMRKLANDPSWQPLMKEVNRLARTAVGRENDLYAQSLLALGLLHLPTGLVKLISRWGRPTA